MREKEDYFKELLERENRREIDKRGKGKRRKWEMEKKLSREKDDQEIKRQKGNGDRGVPNEVWKYGGKIWRNESGGYVMKYEICNEVWESGGWPEE